MDEPSLERTMANLKAISDRARARGTRQYVTIKREVSTMTAYDQLLSKAADLRKADAALDEPESIAKAAAEHPELYVAYQDERRLGVKHLAPMKKRESSPTKTPALRVLELKAAAIQKDEKVTPETAMALAVERHPQIYAEYRAERHAIVKGGR
jgi:hypothetical protein